MTASSPFDDRRSGVGGASRCRHTACPGQPRPCSLHRITARWQQCGHAPAAGHQGSTSHSLLPRWLGVVSMSLSLALGRCGLASAQVRGPWLQARSVPPAHVHEVPMVQWWRQQPGAQVTTCWIAVGSWCRGVGQCMFGWHGEGRGTPPAVYLHLGCIGQHADVYTCTVPHRPPACLLSRLGL